MNDELFERLRAVLCDELDIPMEKLTPTSSLIEDLGADSLDLVSVAMEVEEKFAVEIGERELLKMKTVGDVLDHLRAQLQAA
jgi:acyl carrier protein